MYNSELFEDFTEKQYRPYFSSNKAKTLVVCGALLLNSSSPLINHPHRSNHSVNGGSDDYFVSSLYQSDSQTWSNIKAEYASQNDISKNIPEAFNLMSNLSFLEADAEAEKEADIFFNRVKVKTKKIIVRKKV